nr:hypothetical protein [Tanacetum cinerariifolium]
AQRNLYKALVDAYESDKIILDTYKETVTLKIRRDDDENKDEESSVRPDRGSKRRREGADDQPIVQSSQHPEWFSQPKKPPSLDRDWNKTLPAVHESIQPWISELVKQADTRSSFNEHIDTPLDFSNFIMNRLRVNTGNRYDKNETNLRKNGQNLAQNEKCGKSQQPKATEVKLDKSEAGEIKYSSAKADSLVDACLDLDPIVDLPVLLVAVSDGVLADSGSLPSLRLFDPRSNHHLWIVIGIRPCQLSMKAFNRG